MRRILLTAVVALATTVGRAGQEPAVTPAPAEEGSKRALAEGTRLHDAGDYAGAIRVYDAALANDPSNVTFLYEKAYSSFGMGDAETSRRLTEDFAPRAGRLAPAVYALLGNSYDVLKQPQKALAAYDAGLKIAPDDANLLFNLAVTRVSLGEQAKAREALKRELSMRPDHASGHLLLAKSFRADGYRVPAVLAYVRFLGLEGDTARAREASTALLSLLDLGVKRKDARNVELTIDSDSKKDEGDFSATEMAMAIASAAQFTEPDVALPEVQRRAKQIENVVTMIGEISENGPAPESFVAVRYLPYVAELKRKAFEEPFAYMVLASAGMSGAAKWLTANRPKIDEFLSWSRAFGKRRP
jgi:tetratricopeptide (TPR) repeat protein